MLGKVISPKHLYKWVDLFGSLGGKSGKSGSLRRQWDLLAFNIPILFKISLMKKANRQSIKKYLNVYQSNYCMDAPDQNSCEANI